MFETFTQTGVARVGWSNFLSNSTTPFVKILITEEEIVLDYWFKKYVLTRQQIQKIKVKRGVFSTEVQFQHSNESQPKFIAFCSFKWSELKVNLQSMGYKLG